MYVIKINYEFELKKKNSSILILLIIFSCAFQIFLSWSGSEHVTPFGILNFELKLLEEEQIQEGLSDLPLSS